MEKLVCYFQVGDMDSPLDCNEIAFPSADRFMRKTRCAMYHLKLIHCLQGQSHGDVDSPLDYDIALLSTDSFIEKNHAVPCST